MIVISLGWGVQSFTLAAMVALGELGPVDAAIHADTTHEASWTYDFAKRWTPWLEERGVKVVTVVNDDMLFSKYNAVDIPAFTQSDRGRGQLRRQCTGDWKIGPMRRWFQANRNKQSVEQWIGISLDEFQRMKDSDRQYITHRWPLIERKMTREDCKDWLIGHGLEVPKKSSCVFCPYHDQKTWKEIRLGGNGDWQKAIEFDNAVRKMRPPFDLYIHQARKPLDKVDLRSMQEQGQMDMFSEECSGLCGV